MRRMVRKLDTSTTAASSPAKAGWYRGVKLQTPAVPSRVPLSWLRAAVERAVAKNADALAGRK